MLGNSSIHNYSASLQQAKLREFSWRPNSMLSRTFWEKHCGCEVAFTHWVKKKVDLFNHISTYELAP